MDDYTRKAKRDKRLLSILTIAFIGGIAFYRFRPAKTQQGILTDPIQKGSVAESVYGIGTVAAAQTFQLKSGITSTVRKLYIKEGDSVKKGAPLVDLDGVLFQARFPGTITFLPTKEGETVFAQSIVLSLVDLSDRYILVSLEQQGAIRVLQGQKARISFESMRDKHFTGTVQSIYTNDNNFLVRIGVPGLPPQLLPGMTGDVAIIISERADVLLVPVAAVEQGKVLLSKESGDIQEIPVTPGLVDGAMIEITKGDLKAGDRLLIRKKLGT